MGAGTSRFKGAVETSVTNYTLSIRYRQKFYFFGYGGLIYVYRSYTLLIQTSAGQRGEAVSAATVGLAG
jgi:hypothetical protein